MPEAAPILKDSKKAPKIHRSTMETTILTLDQVNNWRVPPFQRPVRVNSKVMAIAEEMKTTQTIVGMITLGHLSKDKADYIVDGQHRTEAFRISGIPEVIADVRVIEFDSMAEMGDEFVRLNSALVRMRPDDLLRALVPTLPNVKHLMETCTFIGYDNIRRRDQSGPVVSLSAILRCWASSEVETPSSSTRGGGGISKLAVTLDGDSAGKLIGFLELALNAWGRDPEYFKLWGNINLALCMWLYRRTVLVRDARKGTARSTILSREEFKQCLMALSANDNYLDWLQGRLLNDRDRSPGLTRIKAIFMRRLADLRSDAIKLPAPAWQTKTGMRDIKVAVSK